jgi:hypothetical protein
MQLASDQDRFRSALMQLYTDQVIDNLIRCQQGLPFVELDYSKITGTITQDTTGNGQVGETVTNNRTLSPLGALLGATRMLQTAWMVSLNLKQENQLTVTADPVVNQPTVYRAYLEFLSKPDRLQASPCAPPPGAALVCKKSCNMYYWVPVEYREDFRALALRAVAMRGEPIEAPEYYEIKIVGLLNAIQDLT